VAAFEQALAGRPCVDIGTVTESASLRIAGASGEMWVESEVEALMQAWQGTEVV
jgi:hypothetical protein